MGTAMRSRHAPAHGRYARAASHRGQGLRRRKPPESSGIQKLLSAMAPAATAKKAAPSSKKGRAGGLALFAAAAGMAYKNRDKLMHMRHRDGGATPPSTPVA